ncbi:MAG: hypothetical protein ACPGJV_12375 [Bacteriovoracaceae bacterium]
MFKKLIFISFLFTASSLFGELHGIEGQNPNSRYNFIYDQKPIKLSKRNYLKNVRPQMRSLIQDFYKVIKTRSPVQKTLYQYKSKVLDSIEELQVQTKNCIKGKAFCLKEELEKITEDLVSLDQNIFKLSKELKIENKGPDLAFDKIFTRLSKMRQDLFELQKLSHQSIIKLSKPASSLDSLHQINAGLKTLCTYYLLSLTAYSDEDAKDLFYQVNVNFISELDQIMRSASPQDRLIQKLGNLNVRWNSFHHQIEKRHVPIDEKVRSLAKVLHRRWTLILKYIIG